MQKEIRKRAQLYGTVAILLAIVLGSLCYELGLVPQPALPNYTSILKTFSSYAELEHFLTTNSRAQGAYPFYGAWAGFFEGRAAQTFGGLNSALEYSSTNIQVAGVDEADTVKTDGSYIYLVTGNNVSIIRAYPASGAEILSTTTFGDRRPAGILVNEDRMVVLGSSYNYTFPQKSYYDTWFANAETFANIYDISNRTNPQLLRTFTISGNYFNSRMIGNYAYFVASQPAYLVYNTISLPKINSNGWIREITPYEIYYSNNSDDYYTFTTFVALNMQNTAEEPTQMSLMVGGTSGMYVSLDNIYVTFQEPDDKTTIYRIHIENSSLTCQAQGTVPGHELNQFSMDEHNNYFRIATTSHSNGTTQNNVYILDMNLTVVGRLEDIAVGERIYSARFMDKKCYLVTFKKVDPLFVIDLSNPTNPIVLGKLKIPGYSDYLHPYDDNHIIGVGKETVGATEGDFAWYQGVKISLFDVSDVNNPMQVANFTIGDRGTDSPILTDHKAFLFDKSKNLLVIPVLVAEVDESKYPYIVPSNAYGEAKWQGAYVLDFTLEQNFELRGQITHLPANENIWNTSYWIQRSLYIENVLYTISGKKIKMNSLDDLTFMKEILLP